MVLKIRNIKLQNFKGTKSKDISFDSDNIRIIGCNGSGKSTLASSVSWCMADTDYNLVKNPNVVPLGTPECDIQVEIEFELDGKPLTVAKSQRYKEKTDDSGKVTSSVTNTYSINGITKSYKDFVSDLESRGIDIDNFLVYTNPNYFLSDTSKAGREKIRKILFEMATDITDEDIAKGIGAAEVVSIMNEKGYSLDEIKAMSKSTIKKITDENGRSNEVINSRIQGMIDSKASVDINALTAKKAALEDDLNALKGSLENIGDKRSEIMADINRMQKLKKEVLDAVNAEINQKKHELDIKLVELDHERTILCANYDLAANDINNGKHEYAVKSESLTNWRALYKKVQDEVLDENDLKCPTCQREYPADQIEEIKANFESSKNERMNSYKARGEQAKAELEAVEKAIKEAEENHSKIHKEIAEVDKKMNAVNKEISEIPSEVTRTDETDELDAKIAEAETRLEQADKVTLDSEIRDEINRVEAELTEVIGQIAIGERNAVIDRDIESLREKRKADEIAKAQAEKLLDEVDRVEMTKNEKLAESINSQFDLVEWHLWDRQKNGTLIEVTEPYIDGKPMSSCANGSLITLAKLSICESLQKARDQRMPIWCDDASLFSRNTVERIKLGTQFIQLIVADNSELIIEGD